MKTFSKVAGLMLLAVCAVGLTGCTIYSQQTYGPQGGQGLILPNKTTVVDMLKAFGSPDAVYEVNEQDIYIFKSRSGRNILGLFGEVQMKDLVIIAHKGVVKEVIETTKGEGQTIVGLTTYPILSTGQSY